MSMKYCPICKVVRNIKINVSVKLKLRVYHCEICNAWIEDEKIVPGDILWKVLKKMQQKKKKS